MNIFGYQFDSSWVFVLLPIAFGFLFLQTRKRLKLDKVLYPPLVLDQTSKTKPYMVLLQPVFEALLLFLIFLILAKPYKSHEIKKIEREGIDILIAMDVSSSMMATDFTPNRLEVTKKILKEFVLKNSGNRIGIVVFGKNVFTLSPLTTDKKLLVTLLDDISLKTINHYESGGTAIGDALLFSAHLLQNAKIEDRDQSLILMSDGDNNDGMPIDLGVRLANSQNIKVHSIGIGSLQNVTVQPNPKDSEWKFETRLVEETLKQVSEGTKGHYYHAGDASLMTKIFDDLSKLSRTPLAVETFAVKRYETSFLTTLCVILFLSIINLRIFVLRRPLR